MQELHKKAWALDIIMALQNCLPFHSHMGWFVTFKCYIATPLTLPFSWTMSLWPNTVPGDPVVSVEGTYLCPSILNGSLTQIQINHLLWHRLCKIETEIWKKNVLKWKMPGAGKSMLQYSETGAWRQWQDPQWLAVAVRVMSAFPAASLYKPT